MSLATIFPAVILDTILARLAQLFLTGAGGNLIAANRAAGQMLTAYHPETEVELNLAAEIISFSFEVLDALSQAVDPDLSLNQKLRLRGGAVSLSRQSHKAQHTLSQLQKARHAEIAVQPIEVGIAVAEPAPAVVTEAPRPVEAIRKPTPVGAKIGRQSWTQGYQQRQAAKRIVENLRKNQVNAALPVTVGAGGQGAALAG